MFKFGILLSHNKYVSNPFSRIYLPNKNMQMYKVPSSDYEFRVRVLKDFTFFMISNTFEF